MKTGLQPQENAKQTTQKKQKKKIRARWIVLPCIALAVAAVLLINGSRSAQTNNMIAYSQTTVLKPMDMQRSIDATGTVQSKNSEAVYSMLTYPIQEVYVEVGDVVKAGDILCQLDATTLEQQIEMKKAAMALSEKASDQQVKTVKDQVQAAQNALDDGTNATLLNAQMGVQSAHDAWVNAKTAQERYQESIDYDENVQLLSLEAQRDQAEEAYFSAKDAYELVKKEADQTEKKQALDQAKADLDAAKAALDENPNDASLQLAYEQALETHRQCKSEYDETFAAQAVEMAKDMLDQAESSYELAQTQLSAAYRGVDAALEDYDRGVKSAYNAYVNALAIQEAAQNAVQTELNAYQNNLKTTQISSGNQDISLLELEQMEYNLAKATVTAPQDGTVTAVYATEGAAGSGLLFIIEDTAELEIDTSIKEYDVGIVQTGMPVLIESDATGEQVYQGQIARIAPASVKNPQAQAMPTSGDVLFATLVDVLSQNTGLRIGMNVRLDIILEEQSAVLPVPYDAVYENEAGQTCVLAVTEQANGKGELVELVVQTGIENDLSIAISGEGVHEGLRIVNDPAGRKPGMQVELVEKIARSNDIFAQFSEMMQ